MKSNMRDIKPNVVRQNVEKNHWNQHFIKGAGAFTMDILMRRL
jgi:hypothetical protein